MKERAELTPGVKENRGEGKKAKIKIVQLPITSPTRSFFISLSLSLSLVRPLSFSRTSDFAAQINVGRSGSQLLILALQRSNQREPGNGVVIELHS